MNYWITYQDSIDGRMAISRLFSKMEGNQAFIHCYQGQDEISSLFTEVEAEIRYSDDDSILRKHYNPLKMQQDIILVMENNTYIIPYSILKYRQDFDKLAERKKSMKASIEKDIFSHLVDYAITKDLKYLNAIIQSGFSLNLSVFRYLNQMIGENGIHFESMDELINHLHAYPTDSSIPSRNFISKKISGNFRNAVSECKQKKNIIFIHLESISNEVYYNNFDCFPNLSKLMSQSVQLKNFYSTASSSAMSVMDLFYGNDFENDRFTAFDDMKIKDTYCSNLFDILYQNEYKIIGTGCNENIEEINHFNMWGFNESPYQWTNDFSEFTQSIVNFLQNHNSRPFAMHIWNLMPHIGHNSDAIRKGKNYVERMRLSYQSLDNTIKLLLDTLIQQNLLDDTVIIGYGDHGDDKWTRAINNGFTHITEPYLNLIKNPAFIFDKRVDPAIFTDIVSMIDLKPTSLYLLGICYQENFPYHGINIFEKSNQYAFSRSLLTNQRESESVQADWIIRMKDFTPLEQKNKSFAIINEDFNLVASRHGIEFFLHAIEPGNYNNLLDFFSFDKDGNIIQFQNRGAWRGHFRTIMMADDQIYYTMHSFYEMRKILKNRIALKNSMIDCDEKNFFNMDNFDKIRPRGFIWE